MSSKLTLVFFCASLLFVQPASAQAVHDSDGITFQVYGDGSIGTQLGVFSGAGFVYSRVQSMFAGSFFVSQSETDVIGNLYNAEWTQVSAPASLPTPLPAPFQGFAQGFEAQFNDANATPSLGLSVAQRSFSTSVGASVHSIILEYTVTNTSSENRDGLYVSVGADFDIAMSTSNFVARDADSRSIYVYGENTPYFGIALLSHEVTGSNLARAPGLSPDAAVFVGSSEQSTLPTTSGDQNALIGTGPFNLAPNASQTVTFAFVAGDSAADFIANATALQGVVVADESGPATTASRMGAPAPNPSTQYTRTLLHLGSPEAVRVTVIDVLGRTVYTLQNETLPSGASTLTVRTADLSPGTYALRAQGETFHHTQTFTVVR